MSYSLDTQLISPMGQGLSFGCMDFERINANPNPGLDQYLDNMFKANSGLSAEVVSDSNDSMESTPVKGGDDAFDPFPTVALLGAQKKQRVAGVKRTASRANLSVDYSSSSNPGSGASSVGSCDSANNLSSLVSSSGSAGSCGAAGGIVNNPPFVDNGTVIQLLQEQNVKKRRLARKAELARESRKRKKQRMSELEEEVCGLKAELAQLKRASEAAAQQAQIAAAQAQAQIAAAQASATVAAEALAKEAQDAAAEAAAAACRDLEGEESAAQAALSRALALPEGAAGRGAEVKHCVDSVLALARLRGRVGPGEKAGLERLLKSLSPSLSLRFLGWILGQTDKFYQDPDGLWVQVFAREAGLSAQQMGGVLALRSQTLKMGIEQDIRARLAEYLALRDRCEKETIDKMASILTPVQMGKLLAWIEKFGSVCIKINV